MAYTDDEWEEVLAFLNDEAEKPDPDGIGKPIDTVEEFVDMIRRTEAIKSNIVSSNRRAAREFAKLQRDKADLDQSVIDTQDLIDNHPGNPGRP